ncbi:hypothetical protein D5S18_26880 [Nocardia panacis]|uniref:non-specific serine/threonine protein kinase n=1 Tax=Nocardia panacis TaxID=2340916 RepID=A0A3A4K7Y9_9NOCA|nr:lanthionine synthetase LanC family protein [Nocardia panacis]RJO70817.1 hypothetical protein D5S18_26880 [Nocardia panacis]
MSNSERADFEHAVTRAAIEYGRRPRTSPIWLYVDNPDVALPDHGWKLHISARATEYERITDIVLPVLLVAGCNFKMARSPRVLRALNDDGPLSSASVGKALTIYPRPDEVRDLGLRLSALLRGVAAPRVLSDRRVAADAPVYYRYGPFRLRVVAASNGQLAMNMIGPGGQEFDGRAVANYRQPPWAVDPFTDAGAITTAAVEILGGRYRPLNGLKESPRGNVYFAEDIGEGGQVIVKQARAYVAESADGQDTRIRVRNERYVLEQLSGTAGIPRFIDHFRHGTDEYLVTSFDGKFNLAEDVSRNGRYRPAGKSGERTLDRLAGRLARILGDIHGRGFIVADLSPKNIVIRQPDSEPTIIDFGLCHHGGVAFPGGTAGYSPQAQLAGAPATVAGDLHALGMTLLYAATSALPVVLREDPEATRQRALATIERIYGDTPPPVIRCVAGLLDPDPERAKAALNALSSGAPEGITATTAAGYRPRHTDPGAVIDRLVDQVRTRADLMLDSADGLVDLNLYRGTAGIAWELSHHLPRTADTVRRLAEHAASGTRRARLSPGLFVGSTGVELLLHHLRAKGLEVSTLPADLVVPEEDWQPFGDDVIAGAAGVGLGHLLLAQAQPALRIRHLAVVRRCTELLLAHEDADTGYEVQELPAAAGLDIGTGLAHGHAGVLTFLLRTTDSDHPALRARIATLYDQTRSLITRSGEVTAVPLCVSWCRGLAGIGATLLRIAATTSDAAALELAIEAGDTCAEWIPYLSHCGACCGISGVGDFMIDLAAATGADRFGAAARSAAEQLLLRGIAEDLDPHDETSNISWSSGHAGVLAFLRRLHTGDTTGTLGPIPLERGPRVDLLRTGGNSGIVS